MEEGLAWQRACVSIGAQLWFSTLDVEDPGDSSDSDDDEPQPLKADGRRARGQSGDGMSGAGGARSRASSSSSHNVDNDDDTDDEVADFGADAEADAKAKEESKGPKPPTPVPCLLPPARVLLPPTAFLQPAAASARTPSAFATLWSALPFARTVQAKSPINQSARSDITINRVDMQLGQSHPGARVRLAAATNAHMASGCSAATVASSNSSNSSDVAAAASSGMQTASQLAQQWRGSATFAFLWRSDAASQWVAVVVSALRVVDPPLLQQQRRTKKMPLQQRSQVPLSSDSTAEGEAKDDEVHMPLPHVSASSPPRASTTSERPVADVLGDVCFAAGVPDGLPPANAVTEAAKRAGPAYAAALRRRNAAQPQAPPGLREQLHMLAHLYGIPTTTTTVDAEAEAPATPVGEEKDEEISEGAAKADPPSAAAGKAGVDEQAKAAVDKQAGAAGSPSSLAEAAGGTQNAIRRKGNRLPSSEWVFEVETRSGDAAFLASLFAPYALPAAAGSSSSLLSRAVAEMAVMNGSTNQTAAAAAAAKPTMCAGTHWLNFVGGLELDTPGSLLSNKSENSTAAAAAEVSNASTSTAAPPAADSSEATKSPRLRMLSMGLHAPQELPQHGAVEKPEGVTREEGKPNNTSPEAATKSVLPAWRRLREERKRLGLCRTVC
jgi:hypothetical protein